MNKLQHSIERKAFESILDNVIKQGQDHDVMDSIDSLFSPDFRTSFSII